MKRKIMAVLMVLVLLSALPLSVSADCAHGNLTQDTAGAVHMQTCGDCGETVTSETHFDENGDGACDVAWCQKVLVDNAQEPETPDPCTHPAESIVNCVCDLCKQTVHVLNPDKGGNNDTEHWTTCDCGAKEHRESHNFIEKNDQNNHQTLCGTCGYVLVPVGQHEFSVTKDADNHILTCNICGTQQRIAHFDTNNDNICDFDMCAASMNGGEPCNHTGFEEDCECDTCYEAIHNTTWRQDENSHWWDCPCGDAGGIAEPHILNMDKNQYAHWGWCEECGYDMIPWEEHELPCDICNYAPCADGNHKFGTEGYDRHVCEECRYVSDCVGNQGDCICDECGEYNHYWSGVNDGYDNEKHWWGCDCGEYREENTHNIVIIKNQHMHAIHCDSCSYVQESKDHTAPCDVCGYKPCDNDAHVYGEEGFDKHWCTLCGYMTDCIDENKDCVCDFCGIEAHIEYDVTTTEKTHTYTCVNCKEVLLYGEHFDDNKDGYCDVYYCRYTMPVSGGSSSNDGLDNVPKTGDVSAVFLGLGLMLMTGCAVAVKKVRSV